MVSSPPTAAPRAAAAAAAPGETAIPAGTGTGEFDEFLAEADFYFQQGLVDEAEFLYTKLLQLAPGHPVVTAQLRKLEEHARPGAGRPRGRDIVDLDEELDVAFGGEPRRGRPRGAAAAAPPAPDLTPRLPTSRISSPDCVRSWSRRRPRSRPPPPRSSGGGGLTEIFQEFQRSVKEQLGDEDFETHYNLGIAYKEMGLMEEAIAEFALAEKSPVRRLNAVSMIALCLREMGRFDEAALRLRTGISLAVEGSEDQKGFLYDLAALHEQAGRAAEAQEALRRLAGHRPRLPRRGRARRRAPPRPRGRSAPPRKKSKVSYL